MARKKDERAVRATQRKEKQAQKYLPNDAMLASFSVQLNKLGLQLRSIPGDGNCLFRALGDQLDGSERSHYKHRLDVVKFMSENRADFEPFVEDDIPFERHVECLGCPGTYAGNDAIVAFARLHQLTVVIHQLNSPIWEINGTDKPNSKQVHISYHNGDHYSSVRRLGDDSELPANIRFVNGTILQNEKVVAPNGKPFNKYSGSSQGDGFVHSCHDDHCTGEYDESLGNKNISEADLHAFIDNVKIVTKCSDTKLIATLLEDNGYDLEVTVSALIQIMSGSSGNNSSAHQTSSDSDAPSTPTEVSKSIVCLNGDTASDEIITCGNSFALHNHVAAGCENGASGAIPKSRQRNVRKKRERKLEKKARAEERHHEKFLTPNGDPSKIISSDDDDIHTVVNETLKVLQI